MFLVVSDINCCKSAGESLQATDALTVCTIITGRYLRNHNHPRGIRKEAVVACGCGGLLATSWKGFQGGGDLYHQQTGCIQSVHSQIPHYSGFLTDQWAVTLTSWSSLLTHYIHYAQATTIQLLGGMNSGQVVLACPTNMLWVCCWLNRERKFLTYTKKASMLSFFVAFFNDEFSAGCLNRLSVFGMPVSHNFLAR